MIKSGYIAHTLAASWALSLLLVWPVEREFLQAAVGCSALAPLT